jgi:hypothetical protein
MKNFVVISVLFFSISAAGQNPYSRINQLEEDFRILFDPIPIKQGQETYFFHYGLTLLKQDSLKKAGQIFDRIYWLDTTSISGKQALAYRKIIEKKVIKETKNNLNNIWVWNWSGTNWGETDSPSKSGTTKWIELNGKTITFYQNNNLIRQTRYTLTQTFDWVSGFLTNHIQYKDSKEEWYFTLTSMNDFYADRLWIEQKSTFVCGNYGECYLLKK